MLDAPTDCTILVVDDEPANLDLLDAILTGGGYRPPLCTADAREALPLLESHAPDLVLLDLHMPHLDGFEVLRRIRERTAAGDYLPVLVLTADITPEARERALSGGARDFLTKPLDAVEVLLRVRNLLETRLLHRHQRQGRERAERLAAENARLFAEAQRATGARDRMLSVVAHDLRNPLAVVAMSAEMMRELLPPEADSYSRETLASIADAAARMQRLVEDLLDVARIEHGTFVLETNPIAVDRLFADAERLLRPVAAARGIRLRFVPAGRGPTVCVDAARVGQVLGNLIGNAIKFTPLGGTVTVACDGATPPEISVADTGPGVPAEQLPHIFEPFWQAGVTDRRGLGLGLWIARAIVEAHGGRIRVDSRPGAGATFGFTLPVAAQDPLPDAPASVEGSAAAVAPAARTALA